MDGSDYLKSDVSNFVKNNIKNLKTVDELTQIETFKIFQTSDKDDFNRLFLLKKILQITINVYNNYDFFKDMGVKFHSRDDEELTLFKCYYKYNSKNDVWTCIDRPVDSYVTEALYKYLLCYTSLQRRENASKSDSEGKGSKLDHCIYCDHSISEEAESCDVCGTTVAQMKMYGDFNHNRKIIKPEPDKNKMSDNSDVDSHENNSSKDWKDNIIDNVSSNKRTFHLDETNKSEFADHSNKKYGVESRISTRSNPRNDNDVSVKVDKREEEMKWKCGTCGLLNGFRMLNCDACGLAKDSIKGSYASFNVNSLSSLQTDKNKIKAESKTSKYRIKNQMSIKYEEISSNKDFQADAKECNNEGVKVDKRDEDIRWKCGDCGLLNSYEMLNCNACGRAKDNIKGSYVSLDANILRNLQTDKNKIMEESKTECGVKNQMSTQNNEIWDNKDYQEDAKECNNEGVKVDKREEKRMWKCGDCQLLNGYEISNCGACGRGMVAGGFWICRGCTFANKFVDSRCEVCFNLNDHMVIRFCQSCKRKRINLQEKCCNDCRMHPKDMREDGHWQCKYFYCGAWSKNVDIFCCKCGIGKDTPFDKLSRGAAVQRLIGGEATAVWICANCCTINDTSKGKCSSWICWSTRYGRRKCPRCKEGSDGMNNICGRCNTMFPNA